MGSGREFAPRKKGVRAGASVSRPRITGDPLDLESDPSLPKPAVVIDVMEGAEPLHLFDRKLYNVLLALSWEGLSDPTFNGPFAAPAAALRRATGQRTATDNVRLRESLDRLRMTTVLFPRLMGDGRIGETATSLLSMRTLPFNGGLVEWNFDPVLRPHLSNPKVWSRISLRACATFRSKYSLVLYELLSLRAGLRGRFWDVDVDELRRLCGSGSKFKDFNSFLKRVIEPAVAEINAKCHFTTEFQPVKARFSNKIEKVSFAMKGEGPASRPGVGAQPMCQGTLFDGIDGRPLLSVVPSGRKR